MNIALPYRKPFAKSLDDVRHTNESVDGTSFHFATTDHIAASSIKELSQ